MGANDSKPERKMVLFGKTGDGKSSSGNIILRKQLFLAKASPTSVTGDCSSATGIINGRKITIVDTPGICDTVVTNEAIKSEIIKSIIEMVPSPDGFIIILKVGRYTDQEMEIVHTMFPVMKQCGEDDCKHISVLFTHGEDLEGQTIEEFVKKSPKLQELVNKCGGRCHVIDNKYWRKRWWGYKSNRVQVENLMKTIDTMVEKNGCFSNELFQIVEDKIQEEIETIEEENLSPEEKRERAKNAVYEKFLNRLAGVSIGTLMGAFLGIGTAVAYVVTLLKEEKFMKAIKDSDTGSCIAAGVVFGTAALAGGVVGGITGWDEAGEADSLCDAITKTAKGNYEIAKSIVQMAKE